MLSVGIYFCEFKLSLGNILGEILDNLAADDKSDY